MIDSSDQSKVEPSSSAQSTPKHDQAPNQKLEGESAGSSQQMAPLEPQNPRLLSSLYSFLVIVSIFLVGFAAFRNTLTW